MGLESACLVPHVPEPMRLSKFLRSDFVLSRLTAGDVDGVLQEVSAQAALAGVGAEEIIAQHLLEREHSHSTVMGAGFAIPHATVPGLPEPVIGIALARQALQFGPDGLDPVRVFFVLLSPPGHERQHVKLLARICRLARHEGFIDSLEAAESDEDILRVIEAVDAQHV